MSPGPLVAIILLAPLAAVAGCQLIRSPRFAESLNLVAAALVFAAVLWLLPVALRGPYILLRGYLIVDALGAWVLMSCSAVYLLASLYAIGYMRARNEPQRLHRFYALLAGFALTILLGPLMNNIGVYWIAIEFTTLVSTFLVGFEKTRVSVEAAWKYIVIVSAGISLALLGIVFYYWNASLHLGPTFNLTWGALRSVAPQLNPTMASDSAPITTTTVRGSMPRRTASVTWMKRTIPIIAVLSRAPDSIADTGAGPSLCASGSQVCIGASPTLVPKPINTSRNAASAMVGLSCGATERSAPQVRLKVGPRCRLAFQ